MSFLTYPDTPILKTVNGSKEKFKVRGLKTTFSSRTNDDVHSSIQLCPLMRCILDTPHMQRLRGLKQLGVSEMTYVPTTHCRFEHSLGVAALSQQILLQISKKQPNLNISEKDIVCVKLAGLLHDIGHGPFSHVYDGQFRKQLKLAEKEGMWLGHKFDKKLYDGMPESLEGWEHEDGSLMMIDALLEYLGLQIDENNLDLPLRQIGDGVDAQCFGIYDFVLSQKIDGGCYDGKTTLPNDLVLTSRDWIFIKECIVGRPLPAKGMSVDQAKKSDEMQEWVGRPDRHKEFLYDVVCNRHSGLDMDKVDYLARDERRAYGTSGQIDPLLIENAYVAWGRCAHPTKCFRCKNLVNRKKSLFSSIHLEEKEYDHLMICYPEKMVQNVMNFFKGRFRNHEHLYTHSNTSASCYMVCDILLLADPFVRLSTLNEGDGTSKGDDNFSTLKRTSDKLSISRAMTNPESYLRLKDSILDIIAASDCPNLKPARLLLNRFRAHKIYKRVATETISSNDGIQFNEAWQKELWEMDEEDIASRILKCENLQKDPGSRMILKLNDVIVEKRVIHHGMKEQNPCACVRFLPKSQLSKLRERPENLPIAREVEEKEYECCIPRAFLQRTLRVYCRDYSRDTCDLLTTCYHQLVDMTKKKYAGIDNRTNQNQGFYEDDFDEGFAPVMLSQSPRAYNESASALSNSILSDRSEGIQNEQPRKRLFSALETHLDSP